MVKNNKYIRYFTESILNNEYNNLNELYCLLEINEILLSLNTSNKKSSEKNIFNILEYFNIKKNDIRLILELSYELLYESQLEDFKRALRKALDEANENQRKKMAKQLGKPNLEDLPSKKLTGKPDFENLPSKKMFEKPEIGKSTIDGDDIGKDVLIPLDGGEYDREMKKMMKAYGIGGNIRAGGMAHFKKAHETVKDEQKGILAKSTERLKTFRNSPNFNKYAIGAGAAAAGGLGYLAYKLWKKRQQENQEKKK
jgi:hypothetical protein